MKKIFYSIFALCFLISVKGFSCTEKSMLLKAADIDALRESLIMNRGWVPYPDYPDRDGWDKLLGELAEGKGRFINQLINGVFYSCEMTSWSLSVHLSLQHSKRSLPDFKEHVIDLTVGDMGAMLAMLWPIPGEEIDINPKLNNNPGWE